MGRPVGRHNADYAASREALLERLAAQVVRPHGAQTSIRELARAAGVTPPTLHHYFGTREDVLEAVLKHQRGRGQRFLDAAANHPVRGVRASLQWLLSSLVMGWQAAVGSIHALGFSAGLGDARLGPAYVNEVLEPTLQATEARLRRHISAGELERCDVRHAAIELIAPVVLGLFHQDNLFGSRCRPLDLDVFLRDHLKRFLRAYAPRS
jgi:AcrR family transcriptional regulator